MKKLINTLIFGGFLLIIVGAVFGIKTKLIKDEIIAYVDINNSVHIENGKLKIKKGESGEINIKISTEEEGFYLFKLTLPDEIKIYEDKNQTKEIKQIYKIYNNKSDNDNITLYYENTGNDYQGDLNLYARKGELSGTIINKATQKEYFWSDEYRPLIENIEFILDEDFICDDLCFDISSNISKVYAKLILNNNKYDLKIVSDTTIYLPEDSSYMFSEFDNLKNIEFNNIDTKYVNNMENMFADNKNIKKIDLSKFETSNVSNMIGLFKNCLNLEEIDISNFTFTNNIEYNYMFQNVNPDSIIYVKSAFEQAWIFGLNIYIRPEKWTSENIIIK